MNIWEKNLNNINVKTDVDTLEETVTSLLDYLQENGQKLNLKELEVEKINPEHFAVILRCCSTWLENTEDWPNMLSIAVKSCQFNNLDPEDVLYGMI